MDVTIPATIDMLLNTRRYCVDLVPWGLTSCRMCKTPFLLVGNPCA